ncbi:uncharacterized protein EI90DRAFT_3145579 [Cantharellus anzutake]|uniref:uncharacterized protein n=1 Tax=Cantharellus anzutake TaxID=1750568 RepID=UPI001904ED29|nr:uncharacterized protein EI90DRAFT_3145579 [Cantharellus anzutake]KAF8331275.1 hypothetical protein EI90DRAFT_3145579 [Cantharellus anzutake]
MASAASTSSAPINPTTKKSLGDILDSVVDDTDSPELRTSDDSEEKDDEAENLPPRDGYCVECEDQAADLHCETCGDSFCEVCFTSQHRKGSRKHHKTRPLESLQTRVNGNTVNNDNGHIEDEEMDSADEEAQAPSGNITAASLLGAQPSIGESVGEWYVERSKYTPLRLTMEERKLLRLLEAALEVSEYTDRIDILTYSNKPKRIVHQIKELCSILSGLVIASNYKLGQELFANRDFAANEEYFQTIFELGRRHKILNPDRSRTTYGKLMYILMDAQDPTVSEMLGFSLVSPIKNVYDLLNEHNALALLRDDRISIATREIIADGRPRYEIQREIKAKERAIETLASKYARNGLDPETIRQCLYSIGDNHAFLRVNRDPCDGMIVLLKKYFNPDSPGPTPAESLAIRYGKGGARLSHDHRKQYQYVLQSLTLWREVLHDMFRLWSLAETDLLSPSNGYRLRDTGQGLNRMQHAPKTARMMQLVLQRAQKSIGFWVGSSVIHMGDHNVPNALMFIDKYSQIYRILLPICNIISQIPELMKKPQLKKYVDTEFGGVDGCIREILGDFFRHGFDGSGADSFYDAGSCIDGRLTSAWNWCSLLEKKRYFPVFLLCGFTSFDGHW